MADDGTESGPTRPARGPAHRSHPVRQRHHRGEPVDGRGRPGVSLDHDQRAEANRLGRRRAGGLAIPQCNGGGTYPVPVIGNTCQAYPPPIPTQYQTAVTAFEATAVDEVLQTHGVAPSNWAADQNEVLSWGRNEVRAQEWLDLVKIMQEPATSRGTNDTLVYQWFQGVYQSELVTQAQDAVNEYNKWSDNPCTYQPPGGLSLDGAYTYAGNQPEWCTQPCTNLFAGCFDTPPSVNDFVEWGQYETLNSDISDEVPVAQDSKGETLYDRADGGRRATHERRAGSSGHPCGKRGDDTARLGVRESGRGAQPGPDVIAELDAATQWPVAPQHR